MSSATGVSDRQVLDEMAQYPALQVDGKFDYAYALSVLKARAIGVSDREVVSPRREASGARPGDRRFELCDRDRGQALSRPHPAAARARLAHAAGGQVRGAGDTDDATVKAYYDAHKAQYMTPETVNLRYVELSLAELASKVTVDDAQLKSYYDEQKAKSPERYVQPEQRRVSHISSRFRIRRTMRRQSQGREHLEARAERRGFRQARHRFSQTGSAQKGGDLGWADRKAYVGPFGRRGFRHEGGRDQGAGQDPIRLSHLEARGDPADRGQDIRTGQGRAHRGVPAKRGRAPVQRCAGQLADAALQNTATSTWSRARRVDGARQPEFQPNGRRGRPQGAGGAAGGFQPGCARRALEPIIEIEKGRASCCAPPITCCRSRSRSSRARRRRRRWKKERAPSSPPRLRPGGQAAQRRGVVGQRREVAGAHLRSAQIRRRSDQAVPLDVRKDAFDGPKPAGKTVYSSVPLTDGIRPWCSERRAGDPSGDSKQTAAEARREFAQAAAAAEAQAYEVAARADSSVTLNPQALD